MQRTVDGEIGYLYSNHFLGTYYVSFANLLISPGLDFFNHLIYHQNNTTEWVLTLVLILGTMKLTVPLCLAAQSCPTL